jgi:hypothetical protein
MDQQELKNEINRRSERARALGLDKLMHEVFYKFNLMRDWDRYPLISSGESPKSDYGDTILKTVLNDKEMQFSQRQSDSEVEFLSLTVRGSKVFEVATARGFHFGTGRITSFVEGPWIEEMKTLHAQMEAVAEKERTEQEARRLFDEAKRFGVSTKQDSEK